MLTHYSARTINQDAQTVYLNDLIYLHQSDTTILPVQQLRSLQIQLSNLVCACRDDEDFIPQLLPPPPPVRRRQVTQTPSPMNHHLVVYRTVVPRISKISMNTPHSENCVQGYAV